MVAQEGLFIKSIQSPNSSSITDYLLFFSGTKSVGKLSVAKEMPIEKSFIWSVLKPKRKKLRRVFISNSLENQTKIMISQKQLLKPLRHKGGWHHRKCSSSSPTLFYRWLLFDLTKFSLLYH